MSKFKKILYPAIVVTFLAFSFQGNPPSGWHLQTLPNLGGQVINDMTFVDSLKGFIVTSRNVNPDTATILMTTNGGDNWNIVFNMAFRRFSRVIFINDSTGFVSGGSGSGTPYIYKTTNGGYNWFTIPTVNTNFYDDMFVISENEIWVADDEGLTGGAYKTLNGGLNWQSVYYQFGRNPDKVYMLNSNTGFIGGSIGDIYTSKTTNGGSNWFQVLPEPLVYMQFLDTLIGYKSSGAVAS